MLVEFDLLTVDVTSGFEDWWLDKIEKEHGVRPIIYEKLVATEEVKHHVCSMTPSAQVFIVEVELSNYAQFEKAGAGTEADGIEYEIKDSYDKNGSHCDYHNYYGFWKQDFVQREKAGLFSYDHMTWENCITT